MNFYDKVENIILKVLLSIILIFLLLLFSTSSKIIYGIIADIIFIGILFAIYRKKIIEDFKKYFNKDFFKNYKTTLKYWGFGLLIMFFSNAIIIELTKGGISQNETIVRNMIDKFPLYMFFQVLLYAPLTEELVFRHSIKEIKLPKPLYIFVSGFIFGGLHVVSSLDMSKDFLSSGLLYLVPYCTLGFVFAYLYNKTDNIFSTIMAHMTHNGLAFLVSFIGGIL